MIIISSRTHWFEEVQKRWTTPNSWEITLWSLFPLEVSGLVSGSKRFGRVEPPCTHHPWIMSWIFIPYYGSTDCDFRIWTWFLRKYVYFRVINADINPYCTLAQSGYEKLLTTGSPTLQCCPQVSDHPSFSSQWSTCFPVIPSIVVLTTVLEFSISSVSVSCKFS